MNELNIAVIPHPSGVTRYQYSRYLSEDGSKWVRHGLFRAFHENGALASEGNYEHGVENGLWRDFHENGQIAAEGDYFNGVEAGEWKYWDMNGARSE